MVVLKAKLLAMKKAEEAAELKGLKGDVQASWGDQMRNYVLNPYQMVKDLRTGYEVGNPRPSSTATSTASSRPASAGGGAPSGPRRTRSSRFDGWAPVPIPRRDRHPTRLLPRWSRPSLPARGWCGLSAARHFVNARPCPDHK